jgi:hypothetical protein
MYCHQGVDNQKAIRRERRKPQVKRLNNALPERNEKASRAAGVPLHRAKAVATGVLFFGSFFWTPKERMETTSLAVLAIDSSKRSE